MRISDIKTLIGKRQALFIILFFNLNIFSQGRMEIMIPDIPGYITLKCDFHLHTVFSDGYVWPTVRIDEAWHEGLDAIAITDHLEIQKFKNDIVGNRNRSYEAALAKANEKNIILIRGAEITCANPLGHYNCLFLQDVEKIYSDSVYEKFENAKMQHAFFFWNHPGFIWSAEQDKTLKNGYMQGIEIRKGYPLTHQWAIDKNLTLIGNSDMHGPSTVGCNSKESHRTITLVFARERTAESILDALLAGRTAVWYNDTLIGDEKWLGKIFDQSMITQAASNSVDYNKGTFSLILKNQSDVPLMLQYIPDENQYIVSPSSFKVSPSCSNICTVKGMKFSKSANHDYTLKFIVNNFYTTPGRGMTVDVKFIINPQK